MKRWAVAGLLVLTGCSTPHYRMYLYDGSYRDCKQIEQTAQGTWCDDVLYLKWQIEYIITSLRSY